MERYYVVPPIRILTGTKYLSSVSNPLILLFSTSTHVSANFFVFCAIVVTCGLTKRVISFPSYPCRAVHKPLSPKHRRWARMLFWRFCGRVPPDVARFPTVADPRYVRVPFRGTRPAKSEAAAVPMRRKRKVKRHSR